MDWLQAVFLALIQGLTEFLPISSSAHLILTSKVLSWQDQGLAFDVAVHVGTLTAVLIYFRKEVVEMVTAWCGSVAGKGSTPNSRLAWAVIWGTIPVGLFGLFLEYFDIVDNYLRSISVIAATTIVFGLLLAFAETQYNGKKRSQFKNEYELRWKDVLVIGVAQALALIPGTSRSGITMTAAAMLGFSRTAAARYSFLLSIPAILLPGGLKGYQLVEEGAKFDWSFLILGIIVSAVSAFTCIHFFLKWLEKIGFMPFVWYRMVLGIVLLFFVFS
ncbi:undecaprenyl-diphosphate phosphatase [Kangiella shandongensis]|uniref:undecaprenyl-diphosphate phosphatase n=1 Tax=Kangiella shandongensis TaxID=2763258 RepID=UPI001CBF7D09|nr:undecaprenyl-diphosphate phosphatase [Kangiella shandongensis]